MDKNKINSVFKIPTCFLLGILLSLIFIKPLTAETFSLPGDYLVISIPKKTEYLTRLRQYPLDYLMEWNDQIYLVVSPAELQLLQELNIPYAPENLESRESTPDSFTIQTSLNGAYHSYAELETELFTLEKANLEICRLENLGQSVEGRNIYALKISDNPYLEENEPGIVFLGCHHAREWISVEVPLLLAKYLVENYNLDSSIQNLVNQSEIWIIPLVNPDGLEFSIYFYRYWRKNRRNLGHGLFGVDLNRNYSYQWGLDNIGSSPDPSSNVYRGTSPFSEPETRAIQTFMELHPNIKALISYHSYGQVILYPWGYTDEPSPQDDLLSFLASSMSQKMEAVDGSKYTFGQSGASLYLTNGDTTDWALGVYGIPAFTIELPPIDRFRGGFFNSENDIQKIFNENLPAAVFMINWVIQDKTASFFLSTGASSTEQVR
jgi:murein tripeptide amidase MpaA